MRDFDITQRVLAAIDRDQDPHLAIDIVRRELYEQAQESVRQAKAILILQEAERHRFTESGIWTMVKAKLDAEAVDWVKWGIRAAIAGLGTAFLGAVAVVIKLAWAEIHR